MGYSGRENGLKKPFFQFKIVENGCLLSKKEPSNAFLGTDYICEKGSLYILFKEKIYKIIKNC